jgi:hypothetical protein
VKLVPHPLLERDIVGMAEHVLHVTGDPGAANRRLAEARALIEDIIREPGLGSRLGAHAEGWRIRHSARDRRISVVFRHDPKTDRLYLALVAFGGQDWSRRLSARTEQFGA